MPFEFEETRSPKGAPLLRVRASGEVALADAEALGARLAAGGRNHGWLVLGFAEKGTEFSPAARKFFPTLHHQYRALAAVVTSPIVRAAINLMLKLSGDAPDFRMFGREDDGLAWLDASPPKAG